MMIVANIIIRCPNFNLIWEFNLEHHVKELCRGSSMVDTSKHSYMLSPRGDVHSPIHAIGIYISVPSPGCTIISAMDEGVMQEVWLHKDRVRSPVPTTAASTGGLQVYR